MYCSINVNLLYKEVISFMENKFDFGTKEEKIYKNWEEKG